MHQRILVLDLGSRFTQLIARQVRGAGVYAQILPVTNMAAVNQSLAQPGLAGIILSGSDALDDAADAPSVPSVVFDARVPMLGIGYGMHAMALHYGGQVTLNANLVAQTGISSVSGKQLAATVRARGHTKLLDGIQDRSNQAGHGLLDVSLAAVGCVTQLPPGFVRMASTELCDIAGMADQERARYGAQFHPEVAGTTQGNRIVHRFVRELCGCTGDWNMPDYVEESVAAIRNQVGDDTIILGLSGGVDSSVAAALIHRAIGKQLVCVFVDHGLLRLNEAEQVLDMMGDHLGINIVHVDASDQFMQHLTSVTDPEAKRKIIGREFIEVFQEQASKISDARWLAQGTIYPDVIESAASGSGKAVAVKSHHNVGGLPDTLNLKLLEPLRDLFKDEVRELGISLGLPPAMVHRHPFPGPGLGVRILGEVRRDYADTLRRADAIFIEELHNTLDPDRNQSWYELTSQAFAVFLPVSSVGVTDGGRRYEPVIALRAVETTDFMSARWARLPYELLERVSTRIISEVGGVSRVVYDISGKPPATIEWE